MYMYIYISLSIYSSIYNIHTFIQSLRALRRTPVWRLAPLKVGRKKHAKIWLKSWIFSSKGWWGRVLRAQIFRIGTQRHKNWEKQGHKSSQDHPKAAQRAPKMTPTEPKGRQREANHLQIEAKKLQNEVRWGEKLSPRRVSAGKWEYWKNIEKTMVFLWFSLIFEGPRHEILVRIAWFLMKVALGA